VTSCRPREAADLPSFVVGHRELAVNLLAPKGAERAPIGAYLDGQAQTTYTTRNSSFTGAEAFAFAEDAAAGGG